MIIDELLKLKDPYRSELDKVNERKDEAIRETFMWQYENCDAYRSLCKRQEFNPKKDLQGDKFYENLPWVSIRSFKMKAGQPKSLLCVPEENIILWSNSSGTSGDPSLIGRDRLNAERFAIMGRHTVPGMFDFPENRWDWTLTFTPAVPPVAAILNTKQPMTLPAMAIGMGIFALEYAKDHLFGSEVDRSTMPPKITYLTDKIVAFLEKAQDEGTKGVISGAPFMMYMQFKQMEEQGKVFKLHPDCLMMTGGGWKSFTGEALSPEEFRDKMNHHTGIKQERVRDAYSMTEIDSAMLTCTNHEIHPTPWIHLIPRDFETLKPVGVGERGLVNIINPLAYSYAGVSLLIDDVAIKVREDGCPCGRRGPTYKILGRAKGAEGKGCGMEM